MYYRDLTHFITGQFLFLAVIELVVMGLEKHLPFRIIPFEDRLKLYAAYLLLRVLLWW